MHTFFIRSILLGVVLITGFGGLMWLFALTLLWYTWLYVGVEVIFIAMFIDAYFGYDGSSVYFYTISTALLVCIVSLIKPAILHKNT